MKLLIVTLSILMSTLTQAKSLQVMDTQYGFNDYQGKPTLCIGIYRDLTTGENIALIEDLMDCFWTRKANKKLGEVISIPDQYFSKIDSPKMLNHLQSFDLQLLFYYSEYE